MARSTLQKSMLLIGLAVVGFASVAPAVAQWKWYDKNRQVQYSDIPPPLGTPDKDIVQRPKIAENALAAAAAAASGVGASAAASAVPAVTPKTVEPELEAKRRKAEQDVAARAKTDAKVAEDRVAALRTENCNRARADVRTLDDGGRLARSNARGEREILDDRQRADELRRTRDLIAALCR